MERQNNPHYHYPWREGNRCSLHVDGKRFFPEMLQAIAAAEQTVFLEVYLFESGAVADRFIAALEAAVVRGINVFVLLDDFGAHKLAHYDRARLEKAGANLAFYNPLRYGELRRNLLRDHRKLLIVDQSVAFVGGTGVTDEFDREERPWHDAMLEVRGPCVGDWFHLFTQTWNLWGGPRLEATATLPGAVPGGVPGRVTANAPTRMEIKRSLFKRIRYAERRIWIATAYFIPSRKLRRALIQAARNGVDVRLLLPGPFTDHPAVRHASRRYYGSLLRHGLRLFEYQPRFLHCKYIICDDWISIGSSNIDRWNFRWNLEANQEIEHQAIAEQVSQLFEGDVAESREIVPRTWRRRRWHRRFLEWFWGRIELWLERRS